VYINKQNPSRRESVALWGCRGRQECGDSKYGHAAVDSQFFRWRAFVAEAERADLPFPIVWSAASERQAHGLLAIKTRMHS
jgi:hypothetical protein